MGISIPDQTGNKPLRGRLAPIFLSQETQLEETDLFNYSKLFYEKHQELLQEGFGTVSGLHLLGIDAESTEPTRETIVFDARESEKGTYTWELCYTDGPGVIRVVRLQVGADKVEGMFAKTSNQGLFLPWASFNLDPAETLLAGERLFERLQSPEVRQQIDDIYEDRAATRRAIVHMLNQQAAEDARFARQFKNPPTSSVFTEKVNAQRRNLENLGFTALRVFRDDWLERQDT